MRIDEEKKENAETKKHGEKLKSVDYINEYTKNDAHDDAHD